MIRTNKFTIAAVQDKYVLTPTREHSAVWGGFVFTNHTGKVIWDALENEMTKDQLITFLANHYGCEESEVEGTLDTYLNDLQTAGAITGYTA